MIAAALIPLLTRVGGMVGARAAGSAATKMGASASTTATAASSAGNAGGQMAASHFLTKQNQAPAPPPPAPAPTRYQSFGQGYANAEPPAY